MNFSCILQTIENSIFTATSSFNSLGAFQFTSFLMFLIFLRILLKLISFSPPHSATLALLFLLMALLLCSTLVPMEYIHLRLNILCFHFTIPFDFSQNHPCLLPALTEFVVFALCFILAHSGKGVILAVTRYQFVSSYAFELSHNKQKH